MKEERGVDRIVVNGGNSAAGCCLTPKICYQREIVPYLDTEPRLLRPLNYPPGTPGLGSIVLVRHRGGSRRRACTSARAS